jgi:hypothetical protein
MSARPKMLNAARNGHVTSKPIPRMSASMILARVVLNQLVTA